MYSLFMKERPSLDKLAIVLKSRQQFDKQSLIFQYVHKNPSITITKQAVQDHERLSEQSNIRLTK